MHRFIGRCMKYRSSRSRPLAAALILVSISTYAPSWRNYFVCDDYEFLGRVTLRNAHEYFSALGRMGTNIGRWSRIPMRSTQPFRAKIRPAIT